jgi:hypothetical protein
VDVASEVFDGVRTRAEGLTLMPHFLRQTDGSQVRSRAFFRGSGLWSVLTS